MKMEMKDDKLLEVIVQQNRLNCTCLQILVDRETGDIRICDARTVIKVMFQPESGVIGDLLQDDLLLRQAKPQV
jgi:hypothetical protein